VANDEHLALLRQGTAVWNEWRDRNPEVKPDLFDAVLPQEDLKGANLSGAKLIDAKLLYANLSNANLTGAALNGAYLSSANLAFANLSKADLAIANLDGALLFEAKLIGAKLYGANLSKADLSNANLIGADLWGAKLIGANLSGADFSTAQFHQTVIGSLDLSHAIGIDNIKHAGPSFIDIETLSISKNLPISFLRGCGFPDKFIEFLPYLRVAAFEFYSCFISYSSKDQVFAERLHADLQNKGVRCWFAPHDLPIGAKTWDAIDEAIHLTEKLLLILSKASIASDWVEDEVNKAYAEERSKKKVVLVPIRIDNTVKSTEEPWAVKLRDQRNIGDFRQWKKPAVYQKSLDRLLRDLKAGAPK
jgi:hypothetical protein